MMIDASYISRYFEKISQRSETELSGAVSQPKANQFLTLRAL